MAHLVTAGVDELLQHLPIHLSGLPRLIGERHEGPADLSQRILVVVELLRRSELLLSAGRVLPALGVSSSAAFGPGASSMQGLAHQFGRLLQALLNLLKSLPRVAHVWRSWESLGPHGQSAKSRHLL